MTPSIESHGTMDLTRLDEMERGLDGVTRGPWKAVCQPNFSNGYTYTSVQPVTPDPETMRHLVMASGEYHVCRMTHTPMERKYRLYEHDARHIARLDPDTVRELIRLARIGLSALDAPPTVASDHTSGDDGWNDDVTPEGVQIMRDRAAPLLANADLEPIPTPPQPISASVGEAVAWQSVDAQGNVYITANKALAEGWDQNDVIARPLYAHPPAAPQATAVTEAMVETIKGLREALEPFANAADFYRSDNGHNNMAARSGFSGNDDHAPFLPVNALRLARSALSSKEQ